MDSFHFDRIEMEEILKKEIDKKYIEAVNSYEFEIQNSESPSADYYINLAFIYWSLAFEYFEFVLPNKISEDWCMIGGDRFMKIIDMGLDKYPNNIELYFWKRYFTHISYGEDFSYEECLELLEKDKKNGDILYFYLYMYYKEKYEREKNQLLIKIKKKLILKHLYIISLLE